MQAYPTPEFSGSDSSKLVAPLALDGARARAELAGAVRDLGPAHRIRANGGTALIRKVRCLFPELMQIRGDHDAAVEIRDKQVADLTPLLLSSPPDPVADQPAGETGRAAHGHPLDEIAHRMWEISVTEQQIETLRARESALRDQILSSVNPEHLPLVRWALSQA